MFDDLPGLGKPIADIDEPHDETTWLKKKLKRERLNVLPPALETRLDVERTLEAVFQCGTERQARELLEQLNVRIREANFAAVWGPPSTTMPLDIESTLQQWRERDAEG